MNFKEAIVRVLLGPIHSITVWAIGVYTFIWGIWVANPFWTVFNHASIFSALGLIAPEVFWGCFAMACGFAIMWSAYNRSVRSLMLGAKVAWFHWSMIGFFYFIGDWQNTGGITCMCLALYSAYVWLNIKVNSRYRNLDDDDILL